MIPIRKLKGMLEIIQYRIRNSVSKNSPTAPQNIAPIPVCQEMPIAPTTTKAKKAFSPIAGASATGKLANIPIAILPIPAIKQVVTNTTFGSICAAPRICGFTKTMYTMVKKVVIPAINSVRTVVPC